MKGQTPTLWLSEAIQGPNAKISFAALKTTKQTPKSLSSFKTQGLGWLHHLKTTQEEKQSPGNWCNFALAPEEPVWRNQRSVPELTKSILVQPGLGRS